MNAAPTISLPGSSARSADEVKLLALTLDERALMLSALNDPPERLGELRAVLLADDQ